MEKKYILTDETITLDSGIVLHRIKAIRSFKWVNEGDLGGWIEKEDNLSHDGDCWVYNNARVYGSAKIYDNAIVCDNAIVYGNATVSGNAKIRGNVRIFDYAYIWGNAKVFNNACVYGHAKVYGNAIISNRVKIYGNAKVYGHAIVCDNAKVYDNAHVCDYADIYGNAEIQSNNDYIVFKNWWSSGRYFTWTRSNNMWRVGCFYGTGDELVKKAYEDSEISGREYERIVKYIESILKEK